MQMLIRQILSLILLSPALVWAATYTLPADAGSGQFNNCSAVGGDVSCSGNLRLNNDDIVIISQNVNLTLLNNLDIRHRVQINTANIFTLNITLLGSLNSANRDDIVVYANLTSNGHILLDNDLTWVGNISANGNITIGNNANITGDVTAGGNLTLGTGSAVVGSCTPSHAACSPPAQSISGGYCESFDAAIPADWTVSGSGQAGISNQAFSSGPNSLYLRNTEVSVETNDFELSPYSNVDLTVWVRRGDDSFSEDPDTDEDLTIQYRTSGGTWTTLITYLGDAINGEILTPTFSLSGAQLHDTFALRFWKKDGNNGDFDYWHIDDVCLTPASTYSPAIEYRFDEPSWNGSANEVTDSSTNVIHGVADSASATTTSSDGVLCNAASFNGVDQFITSPDLTSLQTTSSVSFWIKTPNGYTGNNTNWQAPGITGREIAGSTNDIFWGWIDGSGRIGIAKGDDTNGKSSSSINDGTYHHLIITWDDSTGVVNVYLDGVLDRTGSTNTNPTTAVFNSIGRIENSNGSFQYLNALVDELVIFNSILSATDATDIYNLQSTGKNLDGTTRTCTATPTPATPLTWFSLDSIVAGQYTDLTGNGFSLDTTGSAIAVDSSQGKVCSANEIGENSGQSNIAGLNSTINAGSDLGEDGAVSFWFNSNNNWNAYSSSRILFDASDGSRFFTLQLDSSGRLVFAVEDDSDDDFIFSTDILGFTAGDWHHISIAWDLPNQQVQFFVNGAAITTTFSTGNWGNYGTLPTLNSIIFGDARDTSSYNSIVQSSNGIFDEIYTFDTTINANEALWVYQETHVCPIDPISYYQFEETTWVGATDEVKDETSNALDMTNNSNNASITAGRLCTGAYFSGIQGQISRPNDAAIDDYSTGFGATLWMNPTELPVGSNHTLINKVDVFGLRYTPSGQLRLNYYDGANVSQVITTSGLNINTNSWYNVAVSVSTTYQRVWLDGQLVIDNSTITTLIGTSTGDFKIGANTSAASASTFAGRIDELRVYNEPITQTEVTRDLLATHSCDTSLIGWYHLEEGSYSGAAGEIIDYSGNRNNGFSEGATPRDTGYLCYGATIPNNNSQTAKEGIETGIDLDNDLGNQGTIMLWYNSAESWNSGRNRVLIDASTDTSSPGSANNKYFFLSIDADGHLRFEFEDAIDDDDFNIDEPTPATPRAAGQWYHVAITWDYTIPDNSNTGFQIFVDGSLVGNIITRRNGQFINGMPNFQRVHFGDNASEYSYVPDGSANGTIDEIRLYDKLLTAAEITDASIETHPCAGAAIVRYRFDETVWNGTPDEVGDDSGFSYDGVAVGSVNPVAYTSTCRAAYFDHDDGAPSTINAIATPMDIDRDIGNEGSIMMWVKPNANWGAFTAERNLFDASQNPREFYGSINPAGVITFVAMDSSSNKYSLTTAAQSFLNDEWVHVAFVWNFATQNLAIYINGVLATAPTPGFGVFDIADLPTLYIGDSRNQRTSSTHNSWFGWLEDARVYNYERTIGEVNADIADFSPCVETLNHFDIDETSAPFGTAINCQAEPISISAKLADNSDAISFIGTVSLSTSTGNGSWAYSGTNTFVPGLADSGTATIEFIASNNGVMTGLTLEDTHAETVNINVVFNLVSETSGSADANDDPSITFEQSGFQLSDSLTNPITPLTSGLELVAGVDSSALYLRAVTTDPNTGVCSPLFSGSKDIVMGTTCVNPNTCAAGEQINISNASVTSVLSNPENQIGGTNTSAVSTVFGADSTAEFTVNSADVGIHNHTFSYELLDLNNNSSGEILTTDINYYVRPASIIISDRETVLGAELDQSNLEIAGETFVAKLQAFGGQATPLPVNSFNRIDTDSTTAGTQHYDITWSPTINTPASGINGVLTGSAANQSNKASWSPDGEKLTTNLTYTEITSINLSADISDFWGDAHTTIVNYTTPSLIVGNFIPDHIRLASATTATWGSGNAYQGQSESITNLSYDISAYGSTDSVINNYDNVSPSFSNSGANILKKDATNATIGGTLNSNLTWTVTNAIDDHLIQLDASLTNIIWNRKLIPPTSSDAQNIASLTNIGAFALPLSSFEDNNSACVKTSAADACPAAALTTSFNVIPRPIYYVRVALPDQIDASEQSAVIPLTFEYLSAVTNVGGEDVFTFLPVANESSLTQFDFTGLNDSTTCTLKALDSLDLTLSSTLCAAVSNSTFTPGSTFDDPAGAGTQQMVAGLGLYKATADRDVKGITELQLRDPNWATWYWQGDADNNGLLEPGELLLDSTMVLFGEYQGRAPILFVVPGYR